jgi:hypothetical protein
MKVFKIDAMALFAAQKVDFNSKKNLVDFVFQSIDVLVSMYFII